MLTDRLQKHTIYTKERLLAKLDDCIKKTYSALVIVFAKGEDKPNGGDAFHHLHFFNSLWELIETNQFNSAETIDLFYQHLEAVLTTKISTYYASINQSNNIHKEMQELFIEIIRFCHVMAKEKYVLTSLGEIDSIADELKGVANQCNEIKKYANQVEAESWRLKLIQFNTELNYLHAKINASGYGDIRISSDDLKQDKEKINSYSLESQLNGLPHISMLNRIINRLREAVNMDDNKKIEQAQAELRLEKDKIENVRNAVTQLLSHKIDTTHKQIEVLTHCCDEMNKRLINLLNQNQILQNKRLSLLAYMDNEAQSGWKSHYNKIAISINSLVQACNKQNKAERHFFY